MIITEGAAKGLERCWRFLAEKNPQASKRATQAIGQVFELLESSHTIGRPLDGFEVQRYENALSVYVKAYFNES
jgi:plasmid stabilization system protein ParE